MESIENFNNTNSEITIKHFVLSGGGSTGLSFYGILRETNKKGIWNIDNISTMYTTSIGCIIAIAIALRYDWETLDDYLIKRPWQTVFQFDVYSSMNIFQNKGIFNIKIFEDILTPLLLGKEMTLEITMKEFYQQTGIELHIFTTEVNKLNSVDISYKTHPDWKLIQAVYCSSSLPIIFEPYIDGDNCYLDGGILMNYPLNQCISNVEDHIDSILGIEKNNISTKISITKNTYFLDFVTTLIVRLWDRILHDFEGDHTVKPKHSYTIYEYPVNLQDIIKTTSSMEERIRLIQVGHDIVHSEKYDNIDLDTSVGCDLVRDVGRDVGCDIDTHIKQCKNL